ncbi:EscU/YscU/HrcU family type III secretion system export apparatus switch protein [Noviherbaspirillum galbum]|uniref:EscU/YscU/HrcU family type III secretion system export apparatus switch protein n=1 Tax=Noviherbaspirillum galbum TaxID=2709383 RepID=A0A6B3SUH5_9BURK|nr:EscU/YscU/HrcU family type III secretion system export apparatus switch protein [Noviherbaspirillum galbum]NEX63015.1 EscU/YscU/HrcU family type III secretion system export apparatus switch protein [Noviherbaspirillum galbum]
MADQDQDRSEEATPYKLQEARKKGNVPKSADLSAVVVLATMALMCYATGWDMLRGLLRLQQDLLRHAGDPRWGSEQALPLLGQALMDGLHLLGPLFLALALTSIAAGFLQAGAVFSFHPLKPDFDRIHPLEGFKRVFSWRIVYEAAKSLIKLGVLSSVAWTAIKHAVPELVRQTALDPRSYLPTLLKLGNGLSVKIVACLALIAAIDFIHSRRDHAKRMRMSRRDIRDESKQREGDPRIRSRIRQLRREMLKRSQGLRRVASADVLITNPTRLAVALSYQHGDSAAPKVIAKGAGGLARKMREAAARHQIPVVQNRTLARALFKEVGDEGFVPERWYPQVAKILVWVYSMREAKRRSGGES